MVREYYVYDAWWLLKKLLKKVLESKKINFIYAELPVSLCKSVHFRIIRRKNHSPREQSLLQSGNAHYFAIVIQV